MKTSDIEVVLNKDSFLSTCLSKDKKVFTVFETVDYYSKLEMNKEQLMALILLLHEYYENME